MRLGADPEGTFVYAKAFRIYISFVSRPLKCITQNLVSKKKQLLRRIENIFM